VGSRHDPGGPPEIRGFRIRNGLGQFTLDKVDTTYTLATVRGGGKKVGELIVRSPD
jgi:hypothetical protein